jgi:hypothetical protein
MLQPSIQPSIHRAHSLTTASPTRMSHTWPVNVVQHHVHTSIRPILRVLTHLRQQLQCTATTPASRAHSKQPATTLAQLGAAGLDWRLQRTRAHTSCQREWPLSKHRLFSKQSGLHVKPGTALAWTWAWAFAQSRQQQWLSADHSYCVKSTHISVHACAPAAHSLGASPSQCACSGCHHLVCSERPHKAVACHHRTISQLLRRNGL